MATKTKEHVKQLSKRPSYDIPLRAITANTNPRNPLSASLIDQGWDCMTGDKQIWKLATSDDPEERAKYVNLIQDFDPEIASMAASILSQGLLELVEVCEGGGAKFRLVFGARRCLAVLFNWCLTGKPKEPTIQAFLTKGNSTTLTHRAMLENIRKPQSVIDEARAIQAALNNGENKQDVERQTGFSLATINSRLSLLELEPREQKKLAEGKTTVRAVKQSHAEKNGTAKPTKTPMRTRKEIETAQQEFAEHTKERHVLDWMLGLREKIA